LGPGILKATLTGGCWLIIAVGCLSAKPQTSAEVQLLSTVDRVRYSTTELAKLEPDALGLPDASATRDGERLTLHLGSGVSETFVDGNKCAPGNFVYEQSVHYHFLGHFKTQALFLLSEAFYEGANFILLDDSTGGMFRFGDLPRLSPTGDHVLVLHDDDEGAGIEGVEIWRHHARSLTLEYAKSPVESAAGGYTKYYLERWTAEGHIDLRAEAFVAGNLPPKIARVTLHLVFNGWRTDIRY
jgi:hypothetical protein